MDLNFVDFCYFFRTQILIFRYFLFQSLSLVCSPKYLLLALKVSPVLNFFPLSAFASQSGGKFVRTGGKVTTIIFLFSSLKAGSSSRIFQQIVSAVFCLLDRLWRRMKGVFVGCR